MICTHRSIRAPRTGQTDNCLICRVDIIFDGETWTWLHGLDPAKRRKLTTAFAVDRLTGKHS